jgi:hypothetical protein
VENVILKNIITVEDPDKQYIRHLIDWEASSTLAINRWTPGLQQVFGAWFCVPDNRKYSNESAVKQVTCNFHNHCGAAITPGRF